MLINHVIIGLFMEVNTVRQMTHKADLGLRRMLGSQGKEGLKNTSRTIEETQGKCWRDNLAKTIGNARDNTDKGGKKNETQVQHVRAGNTGGQEVNLQQETGVRNFTIKQESSCT